LSERSEEVAGFFAKMLSEECATKQVFRDNFFGDFRKVIFNMRKLWGVYHMKVNTKVPLHLGKSMNVFFFQNFKVLENIFDTCRSSQVLEIWMFCSLPENSAFW
jgi:Eukaryotic DNA topoisomerase I, DNA binding fragment